MQLPNPISRNLEPNGTEKAVREISIMKSKMMKPGYKIMKRLFYTVLPALAVCVLGVSCNKEVIENEGGDYSKSFPE